MADYCKFCNLKGKNVDFKMIQSGLIYFHLAVSQELLTARNTTLSVMLDSIFTDSPFDFQPYHEAIRGGSCVLLSKHPGIHASQCHSLEQHSASEVLSWISMPGAMTSFAR